MLNRPQSIIGLVGGGGYARPHGVLERAESMVGSAHALKRLVVQPRLYVRMTAEEARLERAANAILRAARGVK